MKVRVNVYDCSLESFEIIDMPVDCAEGLFATLSKDFAVVLKAF